MGMRRILSFVLTLCLLLSPLSVRAEGAPPKQTKLKLNDVLQIEVEYDEENAEWDGKLDAQVKVSWNSSDGKTSAKDVKLVFETEDGLKLADGRETAHMSEMIHGSYSLIDIELEFDHSVEKPEYVPEPTLKITASSANTMTTIYTCKLDGTTEPRMMLTAADLKRENQEGMVTDVMMVSDSFVDSYYNKYPLEMAFCMNPNHVEEMFDILQSFETDKNDVTYFYLNAHGGVVELDEKNWLGKPRLGAFNGFQISHPDFEYDILGEKHANLLAYSGLLAALEACVQGKIVIITDVCFSGQLIQEAQRMGLDTEKYTIVTASDAVNETSTWPDFLPNSYGWFTHEMCRVINGGYGTDGNGVISAYRMWEHTANAGKMLLSDLTKQFKGEGDMLDPIDQWSIEDQSVKSMLEYLQQMMIRDDIADFMSHGLSLATHFISPCFWGNPDTLLYCSNPEYDDGKRLLTVIEETVDYVDPLDLYYEFLREEVVPEIGLARRFDRFTGKRSWDWDAGYWAELFRDEGLGGLLSALVCDLDGNGSQDMITLTVVPREKALIEANGYYYSITLDMYQIEDGKVVLSDFRDDILFIGEESVKTMAHMAFWMVEYEDQIILNSNLFSSSGMSEIDDFVHRFNCIFRDGKIVDGAPEIYQSGYEARTEDGSPYVSYGWGWGRYEHKDDNIAAVEACYASEDGAQYDAYDFTKLYEYVNEIEEPQVFEPLKVVSVPLQASREDAVKASITQKVEEVMSEAGMEAYSYHISCDRDTEEFSQSIIYSDVGDYKSVDTEKMRLMALGILNASEVNVPEEVVTAMWNFEFRKHYEIKWEGSGWELTFMMIPDGTYAFVVDCD